MYKNFFKIVLGGIAGSALGILSGFVLAIVINLLIIATYKIFGPVSPNNMVPTGLVAFLSMGFGAVIGGICGIIFAFRKMKDK
jgi:hypothetical protein